MSGKRPPTSSSRDVRRPFTPGPGVPVLPETWEDGITGNYEGEQLRQMRAQREDAERLQRLEEKDDEHAKDISAIKLAVADIRGVQKATNVELRNINSTLERMARREEAQHAADVDVKKAKRLDTITAGADRRKFWLSIGTAILTGGALGKILHMLGVF